MKPGRMRKENYQSLDDTKSGISSSLHEKTEGCGQQNCKRKHASYTIDDAVEKMGFGKFQILVVFIVGMAWTVMGMETMVLAIAGPILLCEWDLPKSSQALFTMVSFAGMLSAAWMVGAFSDIYGRKMCLVVSSCGILWYGFLCSLAPDMGWMLFLRFMVGGAGEGTDMAVTYYIEFLPIGNRGKSVILLNVFFAFGGTLAVILAMLFLNQFGWRVWIFMCALPALVFLALSPIIPESPRFDLARGRPDLAHKTLAKAAKFNGRKLPDGALEPLVVHNRAQMSDLTAPGYRIAFILVMIIWFSSSFLYYGIYFLTAELVELGDNCDTSRVPNSEAGITWPCHLECGHYDRSVYQDLLFTSLSELLGLIPPVFLLDTLGRKKTLFTMFFLIVLFCSLLFFCLGRTAMVVFLFVVRSLSVAALQLMYLYTPEVYPTKVRAMSLAVGGFAGKIGAIVTPLIAQVLLNRSVDAAVGIYVGMAVIGAICSLLLPVETSGQTLHEEIEPDNKSK